MNAIIVFFLILPDVFLCRVLILLSSLAHQCQFGML